MFDDVWPLVREIGLCDISEKAIQVNKNAAGFVRTSGIIRVGLVSEPGAFFF